MIEPIDYGWLHDVMPLLNDYPEYRNQVGNNLDVFVYAKIGIDIDGYVLREEGQIIACGYIDNIIPGEQANSHILIKRHALPLRSSIPAIKDGLKKLMEKYMLKKLIANIPIENKSCIVLTKMIGFKYIIQKNDFVVYAITEADMR